MGLAGMRERAAEIGWSLSVTSAPGGGTRVVVEQGTGEAVAAGHAAAEAMAGEPAKGRAVRSDGRMELWSRQRGSRY